MEDPELSDHLFDVIDWVGDKLLFATDYLHWDYDEPSRVLPAGVSDANREAFYSQRRSCTGWLEAKWFVTSSPRWRNCRRARASFHHR